MTRLKGTTREGDTTWLAAGTSAATKLTRFFDKVKGHYQGGATIWLAAGTK